MALRRIGRWAVLITLLAASRARAACRTTTLIAFAGSLDSDDYMEDFEAGDEYCFIIAPLTDAGGSATRVQLAFDSIFVFADELTVYEGASVNILKLIWTCPRCGAQLPPLLYADVGALVRFRSSSGVAASFSLSWVASSDDMGGESYRLGLLMAQAELQAPLKADGSNFPRDLEEYDWVIDPVGCATAACPITLMIEALELTGTDTVEVLNGGPTSSTVLAFFTAATDFAAAAATWYRSTTANGMTIRLTTGMTDGPTTNGRGGGFVARYIADGPTCSEGSYCDCGHAGAGTVLPTLRGPTMRVTDGTIEGEGMDEDACEWLIEPTVLVEAAAPTLTWPPAAVGAWAPRLTAVFDVVSMKRTGSIVVYDGADAQSGVKLWDCQGCQGVAPPPLEASGPTLFVKYASDSNSELFEDPLNPGAFKAWTGWGMTYFVDGVDSASGSGSATIRLRAGAADSVRAPFDQDVFENYNSAFQQTQTVGYAAGLDYTWEIQPKPATTSSAVGPVRLAFNRLALRCGDVLTITKLDTTATYVTSFTCADPDPPVDWVSVDGGMRLHFATLPIAVISLVSTNVRCGHVREPGVLSAPTFLFSDGTAPAATMAASAACEWLIHPTPAAGAAAVESVTVVFTRVDVAGGVLEVFDGADAGAPVLWRCAGCSQAPPPLTSTGASMYVTYSTAATDVTGSGFDARYYSSFPGARGAGDGVVALSAAAAPSVRAPSNAGALAAYLDHLWVVDVGTSAAAIITLALTDLDLGEEEEGSSICGDDRLTIYDGEGTTTTSVLAVLCGSTVPTDWIVSSSSTLTLRLQTGASPTGTGFDVAYFSNRAQAGCGTTLRWASSFDDSDSPATRDLFSGAGSATSKAVFRAPSFVFSDGSAATEVGRGAQDCEWVLAPRGGSARTVVLQFISLNLGDIGSLNVTDAATARPLFTCAGPSGGCSGATPPQLVLTCPNASSSTTTATTTPCAIRVAYTSVAVAGGATDRGTGFLAHYFSSPLAQAKPQSPGALLGGSSPPLLLASPAEARASWVVGGAVPPRWRLGPPTETASSGSTAGDSSFRVVVGTDVGDLVAIATTPEGAGTTPRGDAVAVADGNGASPQAALATAPRRHCGQVSSSASFGLGDVARVGLVASTLLENSWAGLGVSQLQYETNASTGPALAYFDGDYMPNATVLGEAQGRMRMRTAEFCAWSVEPRDALSVAVVLEERLILAAHATLEVYAGASDRGRRLFSCTGCRTPSGAQCCLGAGATLGATACGKLFLTLTLNASLALESESAAAFSADPVDGTRIVFATESSPPGWSAARNSRPRAPWELCLDDPGFVVRSESKSSEGLPLAGVVAIIVAAVLICIAVCIGSSILIKKRSEAARHRAKYSLGYASATTSHAQAIQPMMNHARHYGEAVHSVWNAATLKNGECSICYGDDSKVVHLEPCKHAVCVTCLKMYAQAALGDISMFPLRCPLHHTGCKTTIQDTEARRVLSRAEYSKFVDFFNRTVLGDGINCLKCGCFVNLPADSTEPLVQCPYCAYRWCSKCKCPWHPNVKCDERSDLELEEWRELKGAQRCPGCSKIIEKDDAETCNHMVHKLTDSIPCVRDRTDFCYCCGCEVLPEYPHCEADATDVAHFPDGVFQDCRAVKLGYAAMLQKRRQRRTSQRNLDVLDIDGPMLAVATEVIGTNAFGNYFGAVAAAHHPPNGVPTLNIVGAGGGGGGGGGGPVVPPLNTQLAQVHPFMMPPSAADAAGPAIVDDDEDLLTDAERRRRRREQREAATRSRRPERAEAMDNNNATSAVSPAPRRTDSSERPGGRGSFNGDPSGGGGDPFRTPRTSRRSDAAGRPSRTPRSSQTNVPVTAMAAPPRTARGDGPRTARDSQTGGPRTARGEGPPRTARGEAPRTARGDPPPRTARGEGPPRTARGDPPPPRTSRHHAVQRTPSGHIFDSSSAHRRSSPQSRRSQPPVT